MHLKVQTDQPNVAVKARSSYVVRDKDAKNAKQAKSKPRLRS